MRLRIAAKSSTSRGQLEERARKGVKYVELHIFKEEDIREGILDDINELGLEVVAVHHLLGRHNKLEGLAYGKDSYRQADKVCALADELSYRGEGRLNGDVAVIMHSELTLDQMVSFNIIDKVEMACDRLLKKYENISIGIENETVIVRRQGEDKIDLVDAFAWGNKEKCRYLSKRLETHRIGLVLDICHAISTIRIMNNWKDTGVVPDLRLEEYIRKYSEYLDIIHLANARGYGFGKGHAVGFDTNEEIELLERIVDTIREIQFNGVVTLEVGEDDYLDIKRFPVLRSQVMAMLATGE